MGKRLLFITIIIIIIAVFWGISEKSDSYSEPQEALFAIDQDLLLIPAYKINNDALFFFIKDMNNLGAAYVKKGLFGWKAGALAWSPMDNERDYDMLSGYQGYGENLIYGFIRDDDFERHVQVGEADARMLNVEMLPPNVVEKYQLEGLYIWYMESDTPIDEGEIKLLNKDTGEVIDSLDI